MRKNRNAYTTLVRKAAEKKEVAMILGYAGW